MASLRYLLPIVALLPLQLAAGTAYEVTKLHDGRTQTMVIVAEGEHRRLDVTAKEDDPVLYTAVLWSGGARAIALNDENDTWYELKAEPLALRSTYLSPGYRAEAKNVRWTMTETNGTWVAHLAYDVIESFPGGTRVRIRCKGEFVVETTAAHPRTLWLGRIFADTRFPEVNAQLAAADSAVDRFPTKLTLTATRQYDGGPATKDVVVIECRGVREMQVDRASFTRPAEYRNQEPVLAAPGATSTQ